MLEAVLKYSNQMVEARKKDNHNKPATGTKNDEEVIKIVGKKMMLTNLLQVVNKINNYK